MPVQRSPVAVDSAVHIINGLLTPATNHTWAEPLYIVVVLLLVLVVGAVVNASHSSECTADPARCIDPDAFGKLTSDLKTIIDGASDIINKPFPNGRDYSRLCLCVAIGDSLNH